MGEAEGGEGGFFESVEDLAEARAPSGPAAGDVVVAAEDAAVVDLAEGEVVVEGAEVAGGVGTDVGGEAVAKRHGEVVDEGDVAEFVLAAPVDAVLFDRVPAVGAEDDDAAAGAGDAGHLGHGQAIILDMFNHFIAKDEVEAVAGEREGFADGLDDALGMGQCLLAALEFDFEAKAV